MRRLFFALLALAGCAAPPPPPEDDPGPPGLPSRARMGQGRWTFTVVPGWGSELGGPTHGSVVVDRDGLVYVSSDNEKGLFVFSPDGKLLRTMAPEFRGIHSMLLREEDGVEYIYAAHLAGHRAAKLKLDGTAVWTLGAPMECGRYGKPEEMNPTSVAVAPDGSIFVADGYNTSLIHKFDRERRYVKSFGAGELNGSHGIAVDPRGATPRLLVCDRENRRLVYYDLDGNFAGVVATGLRRPTSVSFFGEIVAVGELEARVILMDGKHQIVSVLGDNPDRREWANFGVPRASFRDGAFTAPHGVFFDRKGTLFVQDWNASGAVRKLEREPLALGSPFGDRMVLQRDRPVRVWGWGTPGKSVVARIGAAESRAVVGADGGWDLGLPAMPAGGPHELVVRSGRSITLRDVLVGDVWLCSGQSNMEWPLSAAKNAAEEIASARHPQVRLLTVKHATSAFPRDACDVDGWHECGPATARSFSAVAYFFGRELHATLGVPIGLVQSCRGGTPCESWTPRDALPAELRGAVEAVERAAEDPSASMRRHSEAVESWRRRIAELDREPRDGWSTLDLPAHWGGEIANFDGSVWFRREVDLPASWAGRDGELTLGAIDDMDTTWFNGTRVGGMEGPGFWATPRRYKVPGSLVKAGANVIVVRVVDTGGPGGFTGPKEQMKLSCGGESVPLSGPWSHRAGLALRDIPAVPQPSAAVPGPHVPAALFNAMIQPVLPMSMRGVIWYQGESNVGRAAQYRTLFPRMVDSWRDRDAWSFLYVQLANFLEPAPEPGESAWAELREAQTAALRLPKTAMACAIDVGEAKDIHPRNKQDVGRRLALAALAVEYGQPVVHSGPVCRATRVEGGAIRVSFDHVGGGLVATGGALKGFAIAGDDGRFVWADAAIEGGTVVVRSASVPNPSRVRYAWADNPEGCNFANREGLPAVPFRSDGP